MQENGSQKVVIIGIVLLVVIGLAAYLLAQNSQKLAPALTNTQQGNLTVSPTSIPLPTRSPEEIKIIAQLKDVYITIQGNAFVPAEIKARVHDQVNWTNKDTKVHKIQGDNWGGVTIGPGETTMNAFDTAGTYTYTDPLNPGMTGTVIVE